MTAVVSVDCAAVENEVADNLHQRQQHLTHSHLLTYANLALNGDPETYTEAVTERKPLDY